MLARFQEKSFITCLSQSRISITELRAAPHFTSTVHITCLLRHREVHLFPRIYFSLSDSQRNPPACMFPTSHKLPAWLSDQGGGGRGQRPCPGPAGHLEFSYHFNRSSLGDPKHPSFGVCVALCTKRLGRTFLCRANCPQGLF